MKNFLCVSNFNNDVKWVKDYDNPYVVYDRSDSEINLDGLNVIKSPNVGYNIYDIMTFIIDNYDDLPDYTTFIKGNVFPRHVGKDYFESLMNNNFFTPIFDYKLHNPSMPVCMFSSEGNYSEINNNWYMNSGHPVKYFNSYNNFLNFIFESPLHPNYITFAPGGNYVVPKNNILKYNIEFYKNLRKFVEYDPLPIEAHIIERSLYTIWMCNFKINVNMLNEIK